MSYYLLFCLLLTSTVLRAQSGFGFLGKTIGEAKVMAVRNNIELAGDDSEVKSGVMALFYKAKKSPSGSVDLGLNYTLMFDHERGDTCVQVVAFPAIQQAWVIDTIANRLEKKYGFRPHDQTTWVRRYNPTCSAHLEYVNAVTDDGRKTKINMLRLIFRYYSAL